MVYLVEGRASSTFSVRVGHLLLSLLRFAILLSLGETIRSDFENHVWGLRLETVLFLPLAVLPSLELMLGMPFDTFNAIQRVCPSLELQCSAVAQG